MKSAYSRQFALVAGMILLSFLLLGVGFATLSYQYTMERQMDTLEENASFIGEFTATYRGQGMDIRSAGFQAYVYSLAKISKAHVLLCELDGTVVYSSDGGDGGEYDELVGRRLNQVVVDWTLSDRTYNRVGTLGGSMPTSGISRGGPSPCWSRTSGWCSSPPPPTT